MASRNIHFKRSESYNKVKEYILRLQIQQSMSFMLVALLDSGYFDKKLQDPWALLLWSYFCCKTNCRTLVQSNSALLFFDKWLHCLFVTLPLLIRTFLERVVLIYILSLVKASQPSFSLISDCTVYLSLHPY